MYAGVPTGAAFESLPACYDTLADQSCALTDYEWCKDYPSCDQSSWGGDNYEACGDDCQSFATSVGQSLVSVRWDPSKSDSDKSRAGPKSK